MKYSVVLAEWLLELGYAKCFFVAGGNIMHLLDALRTRMECVPFVHEVGAGIAAETHNEALAAGSRDRAFVLVTAGPGLTNLVTALAGAWCESRELLAIGGQVKASDLARGQLRQRGIQEVDGVAIAAPLCVVSARIETPISRSAFAAAVERGRTGRKGPVFLEICLDAQGAPVERATLEAAPPSFDPERFFAPFVATARNNVPAVAALVREAQRPVLLLGGGVTRETAAAVRTALEQTDVAVMTTWNGMDRVDAHACNYFGRPNQWGQRAANVILQQADLLIALGTRLGLQQTGFNWREFCVGARIVQVDVDSAELEKGHPRVDMPLVADANALLRGLVAEPLGDHAAWSAYARGVRDALPLEDPGNLTAPGYIDPYRFARELSQICTSDDVVIPCSSGGAFTTILQGFSQRAGQIIVSDKGLASMGYGLSAAIGAALAHRKKRTILIEGDGGFTQNLQELAAAAVNAVNLKIFIFSNEGYASIRMTQRSYFGGEYLGCDVRTGLGFPDWTKLFEAYGIPSLTLDFACLQTPGFADLFSRPGPAGFVVPVDPEQTYFPKISSRVTASGSMESAPLHLMSPELSPELARSVLCYAPENLVRS
jgi:acetolactate synthase I/II/III large subunit